MRYLPLFRDISGCDCLVVGGGTVAYRKVRLLRRAGARVKIVTPAISDDIAALAADGDIALARRLFVPEDVAGRVFVIAAGPATVNAAAAAAARAAGVPVNVVDDAALSDVIVPSIVDRSPLMVAVSSGGAAPVLARQVRAAIEALLPADLGRLADRARALREAVGGSIADPVRRRHFWENYFRGWRRGAAGAGPDDPAAAQPATGRVAIVGAGPGDPDLLTLKALQRLQDADVIVHDRLIGPHILDYARRDAELINAGKTPGRHSHSQDEINALLAHHAGRGRRVVRLKGGDPFIFGRGGEELAYLKARGIAVEIVPGITAALGCASAAGIPLTHRGAAQAVTLLTGASAGRLPDLDWKAFAATGATIAVYMGVGAAPALQDALLAAGAEGSLPVAVVENGTLETERVTTGTLGALAGLVEQQGVRAPALLILGEVVGVAAANDPASAMPLAS